MDGMRAVRRERVVNVALMGGDRLNPGRNGLARPVQVCVYLVADEDWHPGTWMDDSKCRSGTQDSRVFASERRLLSSERPQQVSLKMPSNREGWVLVDADFGVRADSGDGLLWLKTSPSEFSSHVVVLNGSRVMDGMSIAEPLRTPQPSPLVWPSDRPTRETTIETQDRRKRP